MSRVLRRGGREEKGVQDSFACIADFRILKRFLRLLHYNWGEKIEKEKRKKKANEIADHNISLVGFDGPRLHCEVTEAWRLTLFSSYNDYNPFRLFETSLIACSTTILAKLGLLM